MVVIGTQKDVLPAVMPRLLAPENIINPALPTHHVIGQNARMAALGMAQAAVPMAVCQRVQVLVLEDRSGVLTLRVLAAGVRCRHALQQ